MQAVVTTKTPARRGRLVRVRAGGRGVAVGSHPSQGVALCLAMLKAALLASHLALILAVGLGLALDGGRGAANAAVAAALVVVFFASGQAVQLIAAEQGDQVGLALVLGSYGLRVAALGGVLWAAMAHQQRLETAFLRTDFVLGAVLATAGWMVGIFVANARTRVFLSDSAYAAARRGGDSV